MSAKRVREKRILLAADAPPLPSLGERAWLSLAQPGPDDDDRWSIVEEHLLSRDEHRQHSFRRWKYFSK
ncbi:MAG: hypothetical protein ACYCPQ_02910 [Elusimicrobiota bacterium]